MLSIDQAASKVQNAFPGTTIQDHAVYNGLFLFRVQWNSPGEEDYDPFVSVDMNTGEVREFSVLADGNITEVMAAFLSKDVVSP